MLLIVDKTKSCVLFNCLMVWLICYMANVTGHSSEFFMEMALTMVTIVAVVV